MEIEKHLILWIIVIVILGFILGWIFPVEGPIDYIYDNYKAEKIASKLCAPPKETSEFTEEELDYINEMLREAFSEGEKEL